jgi:ribosomal protein L11 methyltransferase
LELLLDLEQAGEARGPLTDLGTGSGVLAIAAAKLGWDPVSGYDHEPAAIEAATANAAANSVSAGFEALNLREQLPRLAPTVVANMTAPVLKAVAARLSTPATTLVCSGLLPTELDETAAAFGHLELVEIERRREGDWAALLLRRI